MARKKPSTKSSPAKAGKGQSESKEVCMRHMGVTLCGNPDDVKNVLSLLEQQERETTAISDTVGAVSDSLDETGGIVASSEPSEDTQPDDLSSPGDVDDNDCLCTCKAGFGGKVRIAEEEEI